MQTIKPEKIITTISNLKTGEVYKTDDEWKAKGVPEAEIRRDVKVIMPALDLFPKTKQCEKMSIIRSNIARQLLAEGGAPRASFRSGSGRGRDTDVQASGVASSSFNDGFDTGEESGRPTYSEQYAAMNVPDAVSQGGDNEPSFLQNLNTGVSNLIGQGRRGQNIINFLNRSTAPTLKGRLGLGNRGDINYILEQLQSDKGDPVAIGLTDKQFEIGQKLIDAGIKNEADILGMTQSQFDTLFPGPQTGEGGGGDNEPMKRLRAPITEAKKEEPKNEFDDILKFYGARFEDGGDVRQEYGLGSIVKKATRAVKKVVKSPIGKAALLGGLAYFGPSFLAGTKFGFSGAQGPLALQRSMKAARLGRAFGEFAGGLNPLTTILGTSAIAGLASQEDEEEEKLPATVRSDPEFQKYLEFYGGPRRFAEGGGDIEDAPIKTASMPSSFSELNQLSMDLFGRPYDKLNDSEQEILIEYFTKGKKQGIERATAAMGGMMEQDEMLDLGGKEMDLRGGGFVPLGEYEKKDDVPARLSKNEFVFTADAVRAAGGGSVDKGADVMYKTMKTLENKVA